MFYSSVEHLAKCYGKSVQFVDHALKKAGVKFSQVPLVRNAGDNLQGLFSDLTGLECLDPTLAQQNFKEECDINYIVDRFTRTGQLPQGSTPQFGDFTFGSDYHTAMNQVRAADEAFMSLPAAVRSRFDNDAGKLLDFLADEKNVDEAERLGLVISKGGKPRADTESAEGATPPKVSKKPSTKGSKEPVEGEGGE